MMSPLGPCDRDRLLLLLSDRLAPPGQAEMEEHLQGCPHCQAALDELAGGGRWRGAVRHYLGGERTPPGESGPFRDEVLSFLRPSEQPGSLGRLGPYEVQDLLGRGGFGVVLKAFDPSLHRPVAIKVLSPVLAASGAARQRFTREARAAAAVAHEHVVTVHGVDALDGLPYLVMEFVSGRSLQQRLDETGPLRVNEVLRIGHQTAAGLAAAHAQGLVHRDVKPANILLENGVERVKLTDFGLARAADDASLTQSGVVTGTPQYMAPEQARGEAVDARGDLFSLGSTLYAACAGHAPFRAASSLAVLRRVIEEEPRPLREASPDVPPWLVALIARLMAKEPAERFQTAREVADLLEQCLAHVQHPAALPLPAVPGLPLRRRWRSCRAAVAGLAVAGLLGLSAVAVWLVPGPSAKETEQDQPSPGTKFISVPPWDQKAMDEGLKQTADLAAAMEEELRFPSATSVAPETGEILDIHRRLDALEQEMKRDPSLEQP